MARTMTKVAIIMIAIAGVEAWPLALSLGTRNLERYGRIFGFNPAAGAAWVAAGLIALAYCAYAMARLPVIRRRLFELHWLKLLAIPFALITGAFEEIYFRKGLMDVAANHGLGWIAQLAASAIVFGLAHLFWGLLGRNRRMAWGACAATGVLGGALAGVYLLAGRDVAPCIWAHIAINLAIEPWLLVAAVSAGTAATGRSGPAVLAPVR